MTNNKQQHVCPECDQPMLLKGKRRKHPDDYRHARGCPNASQAERQQTERYWKNRKGEQ